MKSRISNLGFCFSNFRSQRRQRAFTLIEMSMAIVIMSIIMLGSFSVLLMASKALPDRTTGPGTHMAAALAMDQLSYDLSYANTIITNTATDIEFLVQDRNANGMADKIRYTWSGTAGAPLLRYYAPGDASTGTYTYGPAMTVLASTQEFALTYDKRATTYAVSAGQSAEMLLNGFDSAANTADSTITGTNYIGQYFFPQLPTGSTAWKVTRVKFKARSSGFVSGVITCQLRTASSGLPTSTVLESQTLNESRLNTVYTWQQINFSTITGLAPNTGLCLCLLLNANSPAGDIQYQSTATPTQFANMLVSTGSSTAWTATMNQKMNLQVYGTVTTGNASVSQYNLTGVRVLLRSGQGNGSRIRNTVRIPNEPWVSG